jgi:hypothetical protein
MAAINNVITQNNNKNLSVYFLHLKKTIIVPMSANDTIPYSKNELKFRLNKSVID